MEELLVLDDRIRFDVHAQHDIVTSQSEIFLPSTRLYFQLISKEADKRVYVEVITSPDQMLPFSLIDYIIFYEQLHTQNAEIGNKSKDTHIYRILKGKHLNQCPIN